MNSSCSSWNPRWRCPLAPGDQAIVTLEQIVQKDPLDGEALMLAGDYYAKNGQKEKAELRYQTAAGHHGLRGRRLCETRAVAGAVAEICQATELLKKAQKVKPRDNVQRYLEKVEQLARNPATS